MSRLLVRAAPTAHFGWLVQRTGAGLTQHTRAIEAVDSGGRVRGMVAYCNWTENSVQAHMAVEAPAVWRSLLRPAFTYPFLECGLGVVLGVVPSHNSRSVNLCRRLGFREAYRVRGGWAVGDDLLCFEMRRDECPWLEKDVHHG